MRRAKSIKQIYDEVHAGGYDCVLTTDAPLATALNSMVDTPRLGGFAFTPRQIAGIESSRVLKRTAMNDLEVIGAISEDTGISDLRFIYSEVENIREIRRHTKEVEKHLPGNRARAVYRSYASLPTLDSVMSNYEGGDADAFFMSKEGKVAVVGIELFDDLDKHFIPGPGRYDEIDLFDGGEYEIPKVYAVGNDRQIADAAVALITEETAEDFAIVLDSGGRIADAVRAALYRNHIPFKNTLDVRDLAQVRDYINFVSLALDYDTLRVRDVRELFSSYGANSTSGLRSRWDGFLLKRIAEEERIGDETTRALLDAMAGIRDLTFGEVAETIMVRRGRQRPQVTMLLDDMKVIGDKVTPRRLGYVRYVVDNVEDLKHNEQIPDEEKRGVLLADCRNSVYIDRPLVIYIGLDSSWDATFPGKEYIDILEEDERNALRTKILLQQGDRRIYLVRPATNGKETNPSQTFESIYEGEGRPRKIESFRDICPDVTEGTWQPESGESPLWAESKPLGPDEYDERNFYKTDYNNLAGCPIGYIFSKLVESEDNEYTIFGSLLHDFAELYLCYPDVVRERGTEHYLDIFGAKYAGLSHECMGDIDRSRFGIYMRNIERYIDRIRPAGGIILDVRNGDKEHPNELMEAEGLEMCSSLAESCMDYDEAHMSAKFDFAFGGRVIDYKTGKARSLPEIINKFDRESDQIKDFQAMIYLAVMNNGTHILPCEFDLFFAGDNDMRSTEEGFDIMENQRTIVLSDRTLPELLGEMDIGGGLSRGKKNFKMKSMEIMGRIGEGVLSPGWEKDPANIRAAMEIAESDS